MNIVIAGPGALGTLLASSLADRFNCQAAPFNEYQIWLLDHDINRATLLQNNGLILEKQGSSSHCFIRATSSYSVTDADIIFLCVKSHQVAGVVGSIRKQCSPSSLVVFLQNGIGHLEHAADIPCIAAAGTTSLGATLVSPGHVRYAGKGITRIGLLSSHSASAESLLNTACTLLSESDIQCETVTDIQPFIWAKLMINVGINALTALHNCPNGKLLEDDRLRSIMTGAVREAQAVGKAVSVTGLEDALERTFEVCENTAENISSMLQDVRHKRATEIDAINGAIVKLAGDLDTPVPINHDLVQQIKQLEKTFHE